MYRNAYITLLKINAMFILVLCGLGIDVSIEKRQGDILVALLVVSIVGTFVGGGATWLAAKVALKSRHVSTRWVKLHCKCLVSWCNAVDNVSAISANVAAFTHAHSGANASGS